MMLDAKDAARRRALKNLGPVEPNTLTNKINERKKKINEDEPAPKLKTKKTTKDINKVAFNTSSESDGLPKEPEERLS